MDVADVRQAREKLESDIASAVRKLVMEFWEQTDLIPRSVTVEVSSRYDATFKGLKPSIGAATAEVRI